ncbi:phosphatase PAP2 family protein [Flavobacterium sp.]|uniref:phosphatase PAP2 family protein n=1 Tax=Flavobacterium sp. TaxID=239 RepID=UPI00263148F7|nr:phosphatase PAP2 family protein [Flavobacterium sp.]
MLEKLIDFDKELLVFLNNLGAPTFDGLWLIITKQYNWIPLFLFVFYLLQKKIGWKNFGYYVLFTAILILICDQTTNLFKYTFERLRPCNDPDVQDLLRIYWKKSKSFSYFSGHAANSMASTVFGFLILRRHYKYAFLLFLFPLIFAYSRIYLGLHFPLDVLSGYIFGGTCGVFAFKLYQKYVLNNKNLQNS